MKNFFSSHKTNKFFVKDQFLHTRTKNNLRAKVNRFLENLFEKLTKKKNLTITITSTCGKLC